jgi:hypothetical protein
MDERVLSKNETGTFLFRKRAVWDRLFSGHVHVFKRGSWWLVIEVPVEMAAAVR